MIGVIILSIVLFVISAAGIFFVYYHLSLRVENQTKVDVERIRREITSMLAEFNRMADTNIRVLEERIAQVNEIIDLADRKIYELQLLEPAGDRDQRRVIPYRVTGAPPAAVKAPASIAQPSPAQGGSGRRQSPPVKKAVRKKTSDSSPLPEAPDYSSEDSTIAAAQLSRQVEDTVNLGLPADFRKLAKFDKAKLLLSKGYDEEDVVNLSGISRGELGVLKNFKKN